MSSIERATVSKFSIYPSQDPIGHAIGFNVDVVGGEQFYIDKVLNFEETEGLSGSEIADMAWTSIREQALTRANGLADFDGVIGRVVERREAPEYFPWVQPGGAGDAYDSGDHVTHDGYVWISVADSNVWEPGVYGWRIVGGAPTEGGDDGNDPGDPDPDDPGEGYPAWQPWTSGLNSDLYQIGDRVSHDGSDWEATVGDNHWEPGVHGWVQL